MADNGPNDGDGLARKLAALRLSYAAKLPGELEKIEEAAALLGSDPSPEEARQGLDVLHRLTHKLSGSGETFGFKELGEISRQIEAICASMLELDAPPPSGLREELGVLVKDLRTAAGDAQDVPPAAGEPGRSVVEISGEGQEKNKEEKTILLAAQDSALAEKLEMELFNFGFKVHVLSHPAGMGGKLKELRPAALVVDMEAGENGPTEWEAPECLNPKNWGKDGAFHCPVVFLSASEDIKTLLAAVRAGGGAFLTKPVNAGELVDALDGLIESDDRELYRILIVDDDQSMAGYVKTIIQNAGMNASVATDPMKVMDRISDFAPELILMDLYMPGCNGQELAAAIRLRPAFAGIPIVFLSGESDRSKQLAALGGGGDDFLTKSISPEHLIASVKTRVRRFRMLRSLMVRDSMTGLFNHTTTNELLEIELARARRNKTSLALASLDLDHFKGVNDTHGHAVGDRVIKSLARLLKQRLRGTDIIGRMGGEEFAVVLCNAGGGQARKAMDQIRAAFSKIKHQTEKGTFTVTLSCGVAAFSKFAAPPLLTEAADKALYAAKEGGRNRVVLVKT
ncbi:MAG TPA: diguanylate cyclase [Rhodospirillales bacterium]|nr:diguanylate cyclase [Rhodospirillales bacterium]